MFNIINNNNGVVLSSANAYSKSFQYTYFRDWAFVKATKAFGGWIPKWTLLLRDCIHLHMMIWLTDGNSLNKLFLKDPFISLSMVM